MIADPVTGDVSLYHRVNLETGMYRGQTNERPQRSLIMKIGVDAMGGDFAPLEAVKGASSAARVHPHYQLVLFGNKEVILSVCNEEGVDANLFSIVDCPTEIEMGEHPVRAFSAKQDSSIARGFQYLAQGQIDAFLSAGNTGAMLVGSLMTVKAIPGIDRPCLTAAIPP